MKGPIAILGIICVILSHNSCKSVYQNTLFSNIDSSQLSRTITKLNDDYLIQNGDEISLKLYSRKGADLIEAMKNTVVNAQDASFNSGQIAYVVSNTGLIDLPILGQTKVTGMTESHLKAMLETKLSHDYINPYIYIKVENRRIFLFKGHLGAVIPLNRTNTNIFEVIAKSGGLERHMSSSDITIVRGDLKKPQIFKVDLSTINGVKNSELSLQSNDIIYIPEKNRSAYHSLNDISPLITLPLTLVTTISTVILLFVNISK